jgi:hypothetical protein
MYQLPRSKDFAYSFVRDAVDGRVDVFFDPARCGSTTPTRDILMIGVVPGASSASATSAAMPQEIGTASGTGNRLIARDGIPPKS